jgi:hypothetical protein
MNTTSIFLYLIFACLGVAVGAFIQRMLDRRAAPPKSPSDNKLAGEGDVEIFRAWRTRAGKVWLEMDGTRLEDEKALQPEQRQRLLRMVLDLRPWLESSRASVPTPAATVPQQVVPPSAVAASEQPKDKAARKAASPAPLLVKSIVEQINDVLQARVLTGPFAGREISLEEGPAGTVIVMVGANRYEGIDAVPDPEIKALIRQAVVEWEKSSK